MTALHWAALNGDAELAAMLLYARRERAGDDASWRVHAADDGGRERRREHDRGAARRRRRSGRRKLERHDAAHAGRGVREGRRRAASARRGCGRQRHGSLAGPDRPDVRGGDGRADAIRALANAGADVRVTTNVTDLAAFSREQQEIAGGPAPRAAASRRRRGRGAAACRAGARGWPRRGCEADGRGRRSPVSVQRARRHARRPHGAAVGGAAGRDGLGARAARRRRRHESAERRRSDDAAADRDDQRPLRPGKAPARPRRRPAHRESERRHAALCRAELPVGAEGALSAAPRVSAAADRLSRSDAGAARPRRRSERAPDAEGLVLRLQLRFLGDRRRGRDAVLARRVRERRRRDEAAGGARRRPEHPDRRACRVARAPAAGSATR